MEEGTPKDILKKETKRKGRKKSESPTESKEIVQDTQKISDSIIFIGGKPLVNYIRGIETQFTKRGADAVIVKSRGKFISKAVDVVEVAKRSLEQNGIMVKSISIGSETFEVEGRKTNISTMDINLGK